MKLQRFSLEGARLLLGYLLLSTACDSGPDRMSSPSGVTPEPTTKQTNPWPHGHHLNLVVISIDTCRADHLSAYGYYRKTTPCLESLASQGVLFTNAFCQVPDTTPSHASLFTSTYPSVHGAANGVPLQENALTLAEVLHDRGFKTAAFVSGSTMTAQASGLDQGYDLYEDTMTQVGSNLSGTLNERSASETTDQVLHWLGKHADSRFFLFIHYFDPHALYNPPATYQEMFPLKRSFFSRRRTIPQVQIPRYARIGSETDLDVYLSRYDGEIRYVDDQIQRIVDALKTLRLQGNTLIVVTSDHGEDLGEHGVYFSHGWRLFDPALRIPLIFFGPSVLPEHIRLDGLTQTIDIMPTVLDILGVSRPEGLQGDSLVSWMRGGKAPTQRFNLAVTTKTKTYLNLKMEHDFRDLWSLRTRDWKYLRSEDGHTKALFDLKNDREELRNVLSANLKQAKNLEAILIATMKQTDMENVSYLDGPDNDEIEELKEKLRSLGYVQ